MTGAVFEYFATLPNASHAELLRQLARRVNVLDVTPSFPPAGIWGQVVMLRMSAGHCLSGSAAGAAGASSPRADCGL